jgi:hypothetical protein
MVAAETIMTTLDAGGYRVTTPRRRIAQLIAEMRGRDLCVEGRIESLDPGSHVLHGAQVGASAREAARTHAAGHVVSAERRRGTRRGWTRMEDKFIAEARHS